MYNQQVWRKPLYGIHKRMIMRVYMYIVYVYTVIYEINSIFLLLSGVTFKMLV